MTAPNAFDCPEIYFDLGIDLSRLGVVMLKVHNIKGITEAVEAFGCKPYSSPDPDSYVDGIIGEDRAHLTLMSGLLAKDSAYSRKMLEDWKPESVTIDHIEVFSYEGYACIVARVAMTENILEAHSRLSLLPHIDLFPDYKPHITLAYVEGSPAQIQKLADNFSYLVAQTLEAKHLDYGEN